MPLNKVHYLSKIHIFCDLNPDQLAQIDRQITMTTCEPGKIFYMPEQSGEVLFLLKKGRVQLYRISPAGKKLVIATLGPGTFFGEMSLVGQGMHNAFAEAVDECLLCVMSRTDLERLMRTHPEVAFRFVEALGQRLTEVEEHLEDMAFKSLPARLASLLLNLTAESGSDRQVDGYTHQDLAEMLGTYRETITQTLNEFRQEDLVELGRKHILILDQAALETIAET